MAIRHDLLARKRERLEQVIEDLQLGCDVQARVGGDLDTTTRGHLIHQRHRLSLINRLDAMTEKQARATFLAFAQQMGDYRSLVRARVIPQGVPKSVIYAKDFAELCLIALGEHPGLASPVAGKRLH